MQALRVLIDLELVLLAIWGGERLPGESVFVQAFAPVMLLLMVRLAPRGDGGLWGGWIGDRAMLALILAFATAFGFVDDMVRVLALGLALAGIVLSSRPVAPKHRG